MLSALLLAWYDEHKRALPFRGTKDPYRVWVSEIMLQQTRTETVGGYYQRFLSRFPDVFALADAPEQEVLKCWEGLGYYSRARNLHRAAKTVAERYGGVFPADAEALRALPGVGGYTAAAVASIAFDLPVPAMDGNLTRVLSRFHGVREDVGVPSVRRRLQELAKGDMPAVRCGDFNQALMDLGATVCVPGTPDCARCPLRALCDACRAGDAESLPVKAAAKAPREIALSVLLVTCRGKIYMRKRTEALLKNLWVYALAEGAHTGADREKALRALGIRAKDQRETGAARHVFTHLVWNMTIFHCETDGADCKTGRFVSLREMDALPMPTAMRAARLQAERLLSPRIERGRDGDLPALAAAYAAGWRGAHADLCSPDFLKKHDPAAMETVLRAHAAAGRAVYGLWLRDQAAGVLVLDGEENELVSLYLHPDYQGVGIGSAAVRFAVETLDRRRDMKVTCLTRNERALRLYERFGFRTLAQKRLLDPEKDLWEEIRIRPGQEEETP